MSRLALPLLALAYYAGIATVEHLANTLPPTIDTAPAANYLLRALYLVTNL